MRANCPNSGIIGHPLAAGLVFTLVLHGFSYFRRNVVFVVLGQDFGCFKYTRIIDHAVDDRRFAFGEEVRQDAAVGYRHISAAISNHTSELQSRENLVCRLLLEKKKDSNEWMVY